MCTHLLAAGQLDLHPSSIGQSPGSVKSLVGAYPSLAARPLLCISRSQVDHTTFFHSFQFSHLKIPYLQRKSDFEYSVHVQIFDIPDEVAIKVSRISSGHIDHHPTSRSHMMRLRITEREKMTARGTMVRSKVCDSWCYC